MANHVAVNEKGFTVLYEAPHSRIDIVFVHGFNGHPERTWTSKGAKRQPTERVQKHGRDDEPTDAARRSKFPRLPFGRGPITSSTAAPSTPRCSQTQTTDDTNGRKIVESERLQTKKVYWPVDLASITIPDSRILTYGYDTKVRHWVKGPVSKKTVYDHAMDLLISLEALRRGPTKRCRPLLFVAHSLGGIVVKEALRRSRGYASTKAHLHGIFEETVGVLFFGTPHSGADPRNFFHHLLSASAQAVGFQVNSQIVNTLMPDADRLTELRDEFPVMCHERGWQVYSFQEEYTIAALFGTKVVDDQSSCLNNPAIETKQHISDNHMGMCRFFGLQDPEYSKVAAAMSFILGTIENGGDMTSMTSREQPVACRQSQDASLTTRSECVGGEQSIVREQLQDMSSSSPPENRSLGEEHLKGVGHDIDATIKQSLIDQLYFTKIDERLTSLTAAQGKTCRWFLIKPEYTSWRDVSQQPGHGGLLWIKGNPGTGKSTLMKLLFEEDMRNAKGDSSQITLSFFFLARGTIEEKSTTGLYRSLLHQLFEKAMDLRDSLEWMTADGAKGIEQGGWHEEALKQTLTHAVQKLGSRSLTIFVDALDECDQTQAAGMVCFFEELCDGARETQVQLRICFSSRHYPTVVIQRGIEVTLEEETGHNEDIKLYIKSKLRLGRSRQAEPLRSEIFEKSSGIFLWVVLVLDILNVEYPNSSVSINTIRNRLKQIPPKLTDLFEMVLGRDGENLKQLQICLGWILFATRPLKPQELYFAIQLGLHKESSSCWDQEDVELDQMKTFVRTSSKGLAEVTRNKSSEVQFIHESVREFLLGKYGGQWSNASDNFEGRCHKMLMDCCLAQLDAPIGQVVGIPDVLPRASRAAQLRESINLKFPFLEYSVLNVLRHANSAQQHGMEQGPFLTDFLLPRWVTLNNALEKYDIRRYRTSVSLIYILAENNLANLIRIHPQAVFCFRIQEERYGPPILAALATESHEAVQAFLEARARVQRSESPRRNLYEQFCQNVNKQIKLGRNFTFSRNRGILSYLIEQGNKEVILAYLSSGNIDIDSEGAFGQRPFIWAAKLGSKTVVQHLLATARVDVDAKGNYGRAPLSYAAEHGCEAVVQQLIATGRVDVDMKDDSDRTPLSWAAEKGHQAVVQQLIATGRVDVDTKDDFGRTPLSWAAEKGHQAVVQQLIATGRVDVDMKDDSDRTPLSWAAEKGHQAVVQQLIATGRVDVDTKDDFGRTPLSWAAEKGHQAVVQQLRVSVNLNTSDVPSILPLSDS